jgi:hypothetical protein
MKNKAIAAALITTGIMLMSWSTFPGLVVCLFSLPFLSDGQVPPDAVLA